jgi:hypothetical protein
MQKKNSVGEEHNELPRDSLGERYSLNSLQQNCPMQLHCVKNLENSNHRHRQTGEACSNPFSSICHKRNFRKTVCQYSPPSSSDSDKFIVAILVRQIMKELNKAVSEDNIMIVTMTVLDFMQQNGRSKS